MRVRLTGPLAMGLLLACVPCLLGAAPAAILTLAVGLDGPTSPAHAPFRYAASQGIYRAAGIQVAFDFLERPRTALDALKAGSVELCVADAVDVLAARASGAPVILVASLGDRHPACLLVRPEAGITAPKGLLGKKVAADPLSGDLLLLPLFLGANGLRGEDLVLQNLDAAGAIAAVVSGAADAAVARMDDELAFRAAGGSGKPSFSILAWADHGFSLYGPCIAAREEVLKKKPAAVRAFLKAALQAWEACLREPAVAAPRAAADGMLDPATVAAWLRVAAWRFDTETYRRRGLGTLDRTRVEASLAAVREQLGLRASFTASAAFTTAFLPSPPVLPKTAGTAGSGTSPAPGLKR